MLYDRLHLPTLLSTTRLRRLTNAPEVDQQKVGANLSTMKCSIAVLLLIRQKTVYSHGKVKPIVEIENDGNWMRRRRRPAYFHEIKKELTDLVISKSYQDTYFSEIHKRKL